MVLDEHVCPFATKCVIHNVSDQDDYRGALSKMQRGQVVVIVSDQLFAQHQAKYPLEEYLLVKLWAQACYLKAFLCAMMLDFPQENPRRLTRTVLREVYPVVSDDVNPRRMHLSLRGLPVLTICMAPVYPTGHPRFAPTPILLLTWMQDIVEAGPLPKVREVMEREHGSVYDAMALMLPLPEVRK